MKRPRAHWIALLFVAVLALLSVALVRPTASYAGHMSCTCGSAWCGLVAPR